MAMRFGRDGVDGWSSKLATILAELTKQGVVAHDGSGYRRHCPEAA
jgi:hypothetical protein